jgi:dimethylaniline monooxygenase (N-oxide forming)
MKTVIVGAGPSGLVACKTLLESRTPAFPFDPIVLEEQTDVGGTFRYRSYEVEGFHQWLCIS